MTNPLIPKQSLEALAKKFGIGPYARQGAVPSQDGIKNDDGISEDDKYFSFPKIPHYTNSTANLTELGDVQISKKLMDDKKSKKHDDWRSYSDPEGRIIPNARIVYQMMRRIYELRDNPEAQKEIIDNCLELFREDFGKNYPHTGTKVNYKKNLDATIEHLLPDKSTQSLLVQVPEFEISQNNNDWSYLVLAKEQAESDLGTVEQIPDNAKQFLEALLGEGYEQAGAVCQYISSRNNEGNLREVRLWVPSVKARPCERAVVLGVDGNVRFSICCGGDGVGDWPARGVVVGAPKNSTGKAK